MPDIDSVKKIYRVISWLSLAGLIVVIILVLRKSRLPNVAYDRTAANRVQQKFAAADQAKATGQPAQVQMDRTELNSYLAQNLQLEGSTRWLAGCGVRFLLRAGGVNGSTVSQAPAGVPAIDPAAPLSAADQPSIDQVQSTVKDVKIDMDGDLVKAYVVFDYHGKDLSLELDGHLAAQNGYLKFEPVAGKLGSYSRCRNPLWIQPCKK